MGTALERGRWPSVTSHARECRHTRVPKSPGKSHDLAGNQRLRNIALPAGLLKRMPAENLILVSRNPDRLADMAELVKIAITALTGLTSQFSSRLGRAR